MHLKLKSKLPQSGAIAIRRVCLFVGWFVRSLTSGNRLHWLAGGVRSTSQWHCGRLAEVCRVPYEQLLIFYVHSHARCTYYTALHVAWSLICWTVTCSANSLIIFDFRRHHKFTMNVFFHNLYLQKFSGYGSLIEDNSLLHPCHSCVSVDAPVNNRP